MTDTTHPVASSRQLPLQQRGEVEITLTASDVRLRGVDDDHVTVRSRDGAEIGEEIAMESAPGRVWIRDADRGFRLGPVRMRMRGTGPLDIDVPRTARISFRTLSGDVEAVGISGDARWASASGAIRLVVEGGAHTVDSMSGDVLVEATGSIGIRARTVSGDLRIRAPRVDSLGATTTSGDVRVEAALGDGGDHQVSSVSGDVELVTPSPVRVETQTIAGDVRATGQRSEDGGRGRRTIVLGAGSVRLTVRTTSGDILVRGEGAASIPEPVIPAAPEPPLAPEPPPAPEPPVAPDPPRSAHVESVDPSWVVAEAEAAPNLVRPEEEPASPGPWQGAERADDRREAARLDILRALERGELDIEAASRRLEVLEEAGPRSFRGFC